MILPHSVPPTQRSERQEGCFRSPTQTALRGVCQMCCVSVLIVVWMFTCGVCLQWHPHYYGCQQWKYKFCCQNKHKEQSAVVILSSTYLQERWSSLLLFCKFEFTLANIKALSVNPWNISAFGVQTSTLTSSKSQRLVESE